MKNTDFLVVRYAVPCVLLKLNIFLKIPLPSTYFEEAGRRFKFSVDFHLSRRRLRSKNITETMFGFMNLSCTAVHFVEQTFTSVLTITLLWKILSSYTNYPSCYKNVLKVIFRMAQIWFLNVL